MKVTYEKNIPVIAPIGSLDTRNAGEFRSTVDFLISKGVSKIILDASSIEFVSSEGLYVLMQTHSRMNSTGGVFGILSASNEIISLLKAIGLYKELRFMHSVSEAGTASPLPEPSAKVQFRRYDETPAMDESSFIPDENEVKFESPLVIECEECNAYVRVYASGRFMCPSCRTEFTVAHDGVVVF